jgi:hypothetical protein
VIEANQSTFDAAIYVIISAGVDIYFWKMFSFQGDIMLAREDICFSSLSRILHEVKSIFFAF